MSATGLCHFILLCCVSGLAAAETAGGRFESLGIPVRQGGLMGCVVGPDGHGGEALYFNFNQLSGRLFLVQVNPDTGEARQFDAPQGPGAWALIAGPDGRIYLGTWDGALILRLDPEKPERGLEVVGKPSASEDYLWQFDTGNDGRLYACTYPNAKLVRFDPRTGAMEDLGRMHPTEMYARSVAVGPNGKVYVGIGTEKGDLVVFDPATGRHRSMLPIGLRGAKGWTTVSVSRRADGRVYAEFGPTVLRLDDETATVVESAPERPRMRLRDGREVTAFGRGTFSVKDPRQNRTIANYRNLVTNQSIVSLAWEPKSGLIFGGTGNYGGGGTRPVEKQATFFAFDPKRKRKVFEAALVPGAVKYPATSAARGRVFTTVGSRLLVFDPESMAVVRTAVLPGAQLDISLGRDPDGKLVGLTARGVYVVDPDTAQVVQTADAPVPVNCGFALVDEAVYFGSKAELWRYRWPRPGTDTEPPPTK